jgi:hypothetical protein
LSGLHAPVAGCAVNDEVAHVEGVRVMILIWERDSECCDIISQFGHVVSHFAGVGSSTKVDELDSAGDDEVLKGCMKVLDFEFHL